MDVEHIAEKLKQYLQDNHMDILLENIRKGDNFIYINFSDLVSFDLDIADHALDNFDEFSKSFTVAVNQFDLPKKPERFHIRLTNIPISQKVEIKNIRCEHIGKLIYTEAIIKSKTTVRPTIISSVHECPSCGNIIPLIQNDENIKEPTRCGCGRKGKFKLLRKNMVDTQSLTIEEDVGDIGEESIPQKFKVLLKEDLTRPKKNYDLIASRSIRVIGVIKDFPVRTKTGTETTRQDLYLEANNFELTEDKFEKLEFTQTDIDQFNEFSKQPDLINKLVNSVAPDIYGHEIIKEGMLLFIVKGVYKESADKRKKVRDFFHVLVVGDPGTGKSVFGDHILNLSYKCKRAVGKGSSGVGLTASAERDELIGERVISAGMIPMCNEGHAIIDEVDKMDEEVTSHFLSCMEQGVIEINKSRVQGRLKANVGIFMMANPKNSNFDFYTPLMSQISLPKPILTRFDLIFPVFNVRTKKESVGMIKTIIQKHDDIDSLSDNDVNYDFMRKYLYYASKFIKPKLSDEAKEELFDFCYNLTPDTSNTDVLLLGEKNQNKKNLSSVSITGRQYESPIRLAEAYAKLRLSDKVSREDVKRATNMLEYYLKSFAFDRETGKVDMNIIIEGKSRKEINRIHQVDAIIFHSLEATGSSISIESIIESAQKLGINEETVMESIEQLRTKGDIFEPKQGFIKKM